MNITEFNNLVAESGQFAPLFANTPDENKATHTNVTGIVDEIDINGRKVKVFRLKTDEGVSDASIGIVRGSEDNDTFNIGKFTCVRDYTSTSGNKFESGKTYRYFAY